MGRVCSAYNLTLLRFYISTSIKFRIDSQTGSDSFFEIKTSSI